MSLNEINLILGNPSWDIIVLFFFVAVGFFYGISAGKTKLISFLFSLYISGFLFENFYYLDGLINGQNIVETFLSRAFIFFLIVIGINALLARVLGDDLDSLEGKNWWQVFMLSFLSSGLLFSYIFHLFPSHEVFTFSPIVQNLFASSAAFFWWLVLPLVALFLAGRD